MKFLRRKKIVRSAVYTAIAGDYDPLREHPVVDGAVDVKAEMTSG